MAGRSFSCILDERHLYTVIRYVENNPVGVSIVERAYEYRWSSARGHIERGTDLLLSEDCYLNGEIRDWQVYLDERDDEQLV